ncbi:MAG: WD40/YVTN/BNR-like repeat-containing protein [Candidatus Binatia bacterium]
MAIALSHGGSNVYSSPSRSRQVLVGTKDGVVIVERDGDGLKWRVAHRALRGLHISSFTIEPESGMVFAGAFFGSVHASKDGGRTWERRDRGLPLHDIYSLASERLGGKARVYAGTEPAHLFYSDDLGLQWTELPSLRSVPSTPQWTFPVPPNVAHTKFITFDPGDPATIYACIEQGALLKSSDSGKTWKELNTVGFYRDKDRSVEHFYDVHKALIDPRDSQRIYVTGGAGLYVTGDGGRHWEKWMCPDWAEDVYPDGIVLHPRKPDIMFVSAAEHNPARWRANGGFAGGRIYRSDDGGRTWEILGNGLPDRMQHEIGALCLEDWGESFSVFAATTGGEVYCSDDGGEHWSLIVGGLAPVSKKGHERLLATA